MAFDITKIKAEISRLLGSSDSVTIDVNDPSMKEFVGEINKARVRLELSRDPSDPMTFDFPSSGTTLTIRRIRAFSAPKADVPISPKRVETPRPMSMPPLKRHQYTYVVPSISNDFLDILRDQASHVVWLTGPTQCGKDRLVHYAGRELQRKVFQINCRGDMGSEIFFGEKTIIVDDATKQNKIVFQSGLVEQAMKEGLDENGNEVGNPGILFITEAASMPARVAIGINRLLESDDSRRTLVIDQDGGRLVRSHSGLRIVFASNTVGRGATSMESSAYSAQTDALDISLLNRIAVCFRMGYDRAVEKHILTEKIGDDRIAGMILKFRDTIRQHVKNGKLISPFSTAHIVHIADMYRVFGNLGKALYYVLFEFIMPEEKAIYNETAVAVIGEDLLSKFTDKGVDYM